MSGKNKSLFNKADAGDSARDLPLIEAEIKECEDAINAFMRPLKDLREKIAACKTAIAHESRNFDGDISQKKTELSALLTQEKMVDDTCKQALKKSGLLDTFVNLNEQKSRLLSPEDHSQYKPPQQKF